MDVNAIEIPISDAKTKAVAFAPDGHLLVVAGVTGNLREWRIDSGQEVNPGSTSKTAESNIFATIASMDGRWIVTGDSGNKVIVRDAVTRQIAIEISEHSDYIYTVDVSRDSSRIASGSRDCTTRIFDITSGIQLIPALQYNGPAVAVKFSPDGCRIATAMHSQALVRVHVHDAHSSEKLFDIPVLGRVAWILSSPVAWSSDSQHLFIAYPGKVATFDTSTSSRSEWLVQTGFRFELAPKNIISKVSIVTHGRYAACSAGSSVSFWDYTSRQQIGSTINHAKSVNCISISHDGKYIACGRDNGITVHRLADFLPSAYLEVHRVSLIPLLQLSEPALESWICGNLKDAEFKLSGEILRRSVPCHYAHAARSLIRTRLRNLTVAIEDAEKSLEIKQSPIGHIAKSLALVFAGRQEVALDDFDIAFRYGNLNEVTLLLVVKSVLVFICGKRKQAVSRLRSVINSVDKKSKGCYNQVLANMHLKQGEYEDVVQILQNANSIFTPRESNPLTTISLVFKWDFDRLEDIAWQRLCESLYTSGRTREIGNALLKMVNPLAEEDKESAHGRILQEIVARSRELTLLAWTGKPSKCNSCLPSCPSVYNRDPFVSPCLKEEELRRRTDELQAVIPLIDALVTYDRLTRFQPLRFSRFHLHLPCVVFGVKSLRKDQGDVYRADTAGLGEVEFTSADALPFNRPQRLVFVDTRIHGLDKSPTAWGHGLDTSDDGSDPADADAVGDDGAFRPADAEPVHARIIEEVPSALQSSAPSDPYARALELIAQLEQPFSALLLLQQPNGAYKRVAAEDDIVVRWARNYVPRDIRVEVLEVL